jgi:hypothetical protein
MLGGSSIPRAGYFNYFIERDSVFEDERKQAGTLFDWLRSGMNGPPSTLTDDRSVGYESYFLAGLRWTPGACRMLSRR